MEGIKLVDHTAELIRATEGRPTLVIADAARVCKDGAGNGDYCAARKLCRKLLDWGHMSPFEFFEVTFACTTNRAVSHELVRHRLASYMQESQRYCNYEQELSVICPHGVKAAGQEAVGNWEAQMFEAWDCYCGLLERGVKAEDARTVLPEATATKILVKMNLREFRHFLSLRSTPAAWYEMRLLATAMADAYLARFPDEQYLVREIVNG
jgi:thymidylate synthase (FAD)